MKILLNAYPTNCQGGGAVVKINKVASYLREHGDTVDLFDPWTSRIEDYDVYQHFSFFPADLPMINFAVATGVPVIIESMYWSSWSHTLLAPPRSFLPKSKAVVKEGLKRLFPMLTRESRILHAADGVICNSELESELIGKHFRISDEKIHVVANGVDETFASASPELFQQTFGIKDFVLMTGMIEERKNQLALIRALKGSDKKAVIIGGCPSVHRSYLDRCKAEAGSNIIFVDQMDHDDPVLRSAYAACKMLVLPSWHETTGKSALEAAILGKHVIMTKFAPGAKEYFGDRIPYVNPWDIKTLAAKINELWDAPVDQELTGTIAKLYTWNTVLGRRREIYRSVASKR